MLLRSKGLLGEKENKKKNYKEPEREKKREKLLLLFKRRGMSVDAAIDTFVFIGIFNSRYFSYESLCN